MRPEENFESLRRLLTLKRHEQPPPGYFHDFSTTVIARIRLGERGEELSALGNLSLAGTSWFQRLWAMFDARPSLAGALGVLVCGSLVGAFVYSSQPDTSNLASFANVANVAAPEPLIESNARASLLASPMLPSTAGIAPSSAANALFDSD